MELLEQRILKDGEYLGNGILKVDSFMNHQIDPLLMKKNWWRNSKRIQRVEADPYSDCRIQWNSTVAGGGN